MQTWLVTGAARGIGAALCAEALARGHRVVAVVRGEAEPAAHANLSVIRFDATDTAATRAAAAALDGPVDVLIANAGVYGGRDQSLVGLDPDDVLHTLDVNVAGPLRTLQAFLPHLKKAAKPRALMISSGMGRFSGGSAGSVGYRASKAALNKVVQTLHLELGPQGVALVACHPGWVRTDMGGSGADIPAQESAKGLCDLAESLDVAGAGAFYDWTGARQDW
jgi:NAD(P)-dependent dehydrogenase (short-subunit alcohol dehydrogenase family)